MNTAPALDLPLTRNQMYEGKIVQVKHSGNYDGLWIITKINPVNVKLQPLNREGRGLNCHPSFIYEPSSSASSSAPVGQPYLKPPSLPAGLTLGSVVEMAEAVGHSKMPCGPDHLYVVVAVKYEQVNIALMGGDGGRYWKIKPHSWHRFILVGPGENITL